jgi:glucose-6-phosphate isomerase
MSSPLKNTKPDIRTLKQMSTVLCDQKWLKTASDLELYYMYRGVKERGELSYDITVIPARMLGEEFVKTKGHYHSDKRQELYVVLNGEALFLFQKVKDKIVEDVYAIKAKQGDIVIVPKNFGHITINPTSKELKLANWLSKKNVRDYGSLEKMKGGCYFYTLNGWVKNKNYTRVPDLRFEKPLKKMPKNLDFLK